MVDLADCSAIEHAWHALDPSVVIHCAAVSKPQHCHQDPDVAQRVNVDATECLARLAKDRPFVLFSTDQVFDGVRGGYRESDQPHPINLYGETKAKAEQVVLKNPQHLVVRTSLNGGISPTGDRGFNEEIRRAWEAGRTIHLFTDEIRCPIPAVVTARAVWELVAQERSGLYHLTGAESLSRWEIGKALAARWPHLHPAMEQGSVKHFTEHRRAPDLSMNCEKIQAHLSFPLPKFREWLAQHPNEPF